MIKYQYLLARAIFFMTIYAVIYGYDSIGMISAIPLGAVMGIYLLSAFLMVVAGTFWSGIMRNVIKQKQEDIQKEHSLTWLVYGLCDLGCAYLASTIFTFNGFANFAEQMIYLMGVVIINVLAVARIRYLIWRTLKDN